ncbi:zinc transporter ZupT [Xanthomonas arboricola]
MEYDKRMPNGQVIRAPDFTYRVLNGVPALFHIAEWLLFVVAFQYVDQKFSSIAAKVVWLLLAAALAFYIGVLTSNVAWRYIAEPFKNRTRNFLMRYMLPAASGGLVFVLLKVVARDMVAAQVG